MTTELEALRREIAELRALNEQLAKNVATLTKEVRILLTARAPELKTQEDETDGQ